MLTRDEIVSRLKDIMISADPRCADAVEHAADDSRLLEDFGLDSIGMLYIVISIEESFGIRFGDVSPSDFVTLGDVVTYIRDRLE